MTRILPTLALGTALALPGLAAADAAAPVLAIISHPVEDYARWRGVYDDFRDEQVAGGVTGAEVFRDPADPNRVVVVHRFASVDAADAFLGSETLRAAMGDAGVAAPPEVTIVEAAD
ncbi:putative quinol monooxygenase [Jannaschia sp. W003]|uniref:putative quinol monooxygenase n=1 Tax=Jannaschia sp. W003 TaxID=2867012 RepID=UPI0021A5CEA3|nr:antibiotic biosynthesis monooxygenase [Jannaschia sp. W003]UWQ20108.1 antibiotic biosynthesis monooxygenase [Jannaschia sp. W003]